MWCRTISRFKSPLKCFKSVSQQFNINGFDITLLYIFIIADTSHSTAIPPFKCLTIIITRFALKFSTKLKHFPLIHFPAFPHAFFFRSQYNFKYQRIYAEISLWWWRYLTSTCRYLCIIEKKRYIWVRMLYTIWKCECIYCLYTLCSHKHFKTRYFFGKVSQ